MPTPTAERRRSRTSERRCSRRGGPLGQEEVAALFRVCAEDESPAGRRDAAMFAVLYGGGLRRAELCGLDLTDFDAADCSLTVRGKGRRGRTVYLPEGGVRAPQGVDRGSGGRAGAALPPGADDGRGADLPASGGDALVRAQAAAARGGAGRGDAPRLPAGVRGERSRRRAVQALPLRSPG